MPPPRTIETDADLERAFIWLSNMKRPFTLQAEPGRKRSTEQNRLMNLWYTEISQQLGDRKPQDVRAYCKLKYGVPILYADSEMFRDTWDRIFRPMPVDQRLEIMLPPIELAITSVMNTKQEAAYLDAMQQFAAEIGVVLTQPVAA